MTKKFVFLFVTVLAAAISSSAQTYGLPGPQPLDPIGYYINQSFWSNRAFTTVMTGSLFKAGTKGRARTTAKSPAAPVGVTAFKHSGAHMLPAAVAAQAKNGGAAEKKIIEDLLGLYRRTATNDGFPPDDIAYAFEYFIVNNYQVYHYLLDINADPAIAQINDPLARLQTVKTREQMKVTIPQERMIYDQFKKVLSENPEIKKMTATQKQQLTEMLAVVTGVSCMQFIQGSQNKSAEQMEKGRQVARASLEKLVGVSIDNIRITNNGLEF